MVKKMKNPRRLAALAVFAIIAMSAFGFAASNTVETSNAGDGTDAVSGGDVSNIHYTLNTSGQITGVSFDYSTASANPARQAFVNLLNSTPAVIGTATCVAGTTYDFDCTLTAAVNVLPVVSLRVVTAS